MKKYNRYINRLLVVFLLFLAQSYCPAEIFSQQSEEFRVMARRGNAWEALPVDSLGIQVEGMGSQANVVYEFSVFNPYDEVLEGQALLPIPGGASVTGFALETLGEMREASVVDARLGRTAYEDVVRRQIDPGLLEKLGPDIYKLRIFPLPAQSFRKVRIALTSSLALHKGMLSLPLTVSHPTRMVSFSLTWRGATGIIRTEGGPQLDFPEQASVLSASWTGPSSSWEREATMMIPYQISAGQIWTDVNGWSYVELPAVLPPPASLDAKKVVLYWDQSASMADFDRENTIAILKKWYEKSQPSELTVIPFHLTVGKARVFSHSSTSEELEAFLTAIRPDGATDWSCLDFEVEGADQYIMVSDGNIQFGPSSFPLENAPIYLLTTTQGTMGTGPLQGLALRSKGDMISVESPEIDQQAERLSVRTFGLRRISGDASRDWWPLDVRTGSGLWRFAGRLSPDAEELTVTLGDGVSEEIIDIPLISSETRLPFSIEKIWVRAKINALEFAPEPDEDQITALATEFGIVTSYTSLLVLERLEDYVTYRVEPPAELLDEYESLVAAEEKDEQFKWRSHLDEVAELYHQRITWWNTEFKPRPRPKWRQEEDGNRDSDERREEAMESLEEVPVEYSDEPMTEDMVVEMAAVPAAGDGLLSMDDAFASDEEESETSEDLPGIKMSLESWSSDASYIPVFDRAGDSWYESYLLYKDENSTSAGFYMDVANWRWTKGDTAMAVQILGNLAEMAPGDHELLRSLGRKLWQEGELDLAHSVLKEVARLRPEEPQTWRDMALLQDALGHHQEAIDGLYHVVTTIWSDRFPEISVMAAQEMMCIVNQHGDDLEVRNIDERFTTALPTDIRVVLQWDQNDIDMDLWVTDPRGERCMYNHRETEAGGWMSRDFTGGYGPEEFLLKKAIPGNYKIQVNYYGNRRQEMSRPVLVQVRLIRNYGKPNQEEVNITRELADASETIDIGEFEVE